MVDGALHLLDMRVSAWTVANWRMTFSPCELRASTPFRCCHWCD